MSHQLKRSTQCEAYLALQHVHCILSIYFTLWLDILVTTRTNSIYKFSTNWLCYSIIYCTIACQSECSQDPLRALCCSAICCTIAWLPRSRMIKTNSISLQLGHSQRFVYNYLQHRNLSSYALGLYQTPFNPSNVLH